MTIPRNLSALAPNVSTSGVNAVSGGGTGASSLTANNVLLGNGTSAVQVVAPGASGNVLTSNGTTWTSATPSTAGGGGTTATGNVTLTSSSSGAQSITTTTFGQTVTLPNATTMNKAATVFNIRNAGPYPLKIVDTSSNVLGFVPPGNASTVGLADNSTSAGVWVLSNVQEVAVTAQFSTSSTTASYFAEIYGRVALDSNRTFILSQDSSNNVYGVVYDNSTNTFGAITSIGTSSGRCAAVLCGAGSNLVLVNYGSAARTLSISGTTITANTVNNHGNTFSTSQNHQFFTCGSSYVVTDSFKFMAFTVSGTTATAGSPVSLTGAIITTVNNIRYITPAYQVTSSTLIGVSFTAVSVLNFAVLSVSGTTITKGTDATVAITATSPSIYFYPFGSNWVCINTPTTNPTNFYACVVSVSGTTATVSNNLDLNTPSISGSALQVMTISASKLIYSFPQQSPDFFKFNILTYSGGTVSMGTQISHSGTVSVVAPLFITGNYAVYNAAASSVSTAFQIVVDVSGSSPTFAYANTYSAWTAATGSSAPNFNASGYGARNPTTLVSASATRAYSLSGGGGGGGMPPGLLPVCGLDYVSYIPATVFNPQFSTLKSITGANNNESWLGHGGTGSAYLARVECVS